LRIAFLCKRRYMGKDVVVDRYGRLYEMPRQLALLGHDVRGFCLSYRPSAALDVVDEHADGKLRWISPAMGFARVPGLLAYPRKVLAALNEFRPDVIVGASDAVHVVLAGWLSRRLSTPYAVDLYDNFESFKLTRFPGLERAYRAAIGRAAVVSCTGNALADYVRQTCSPRGVVIALPSTVDRSVFRRGDKAAARRELALPEGALLVGTAGGLLAERGIDTLYDAFQQLAASNRTLLFSAESVRNARLRITAGGGEHWRNAALAGDCAAIALRRRQCDQPSRNDQQAACRSATALGGIRRLARARFRF